MIRRLQTHAVSSSDSVTSITREPSTFCFDFRSCSVALNSSPFRLSARAARRWMRHQATRMHAASASNPDTIEDLPSPRLPPELLGAVLEFAGKATVSEFTCNGAAALRARLHGLVSVGRCRNALRVVRTLGVQVHSWFSELDDFLIEVMPYVTHLDQDINTAESVGPIFANLERERLHNLRIRSWCHVKIPSTFLLPQSLRILNWPCEQVFSRLLDAVEASGHSLVAWRPATSANNLHKLGLHPRAASKIDELIVNMPYLCGRRCHVHGYGREQF